MCENLLPQKRRFVIVCIFFRIFAVMNWKLQSIGFVLLMSLLSMGKVSFGQVREDFSDGDLSVNPTWLGDLGNFRTTTSSAVPAAMKPALQLYDTVQGVSKLYVRHDFIAADTVEWSFWVKLSFKPSNQNHFRFYLYGDSSCFTQLATEALCVKIGGSEKAVSLCEDHAATEATDTAFLKSGDDLLNKSVNQLRVKVQRIPGGTWNLWIDSVGGEAPDYVFVGSAVYGTDSAFALAKYAGFCCIYTSSNATKFYIDDIVIKSSSDVEEPPQVDDTVWVKSGNLLVSEILFNPPAGGVDYVELYNHSDDSAHLKDIYWAQMKNDEISKLYALDTSYIVAPHDYVVFTTDAAWVRANYQVRYPSKLVQVPALPSYNDASGTVMVVWRDSSVMDRFDYDESMHSRLIKDPEGVALERRAFDVASSAPGNWYSAASTAGYGTPTFANSQSKEFLFLQDDFHFEPELFSPDGDGYNDLCDMTYELTDADLTANVTIYDEHGRICRHLLRNATLGSHGSVSWDGTDDNGVRIHQGAYVVVVEAFGLDGKKQFVKKTVYCVY